MFIVLSEIKNNLSERRFLIVLGIISCVIGVVFSFTFKYDFGGADGAVFILNPNKYVDTILGDNFSAVKLFFSRATLGALVLAVAFLAGFNSYTVFLNYALIIYKTYSVTFYFKFFITGFAFHGFVIFTFLIFIECLCATLAILLIIVNSFACSVCDEEFNIKKRLVFYAVSLLIIIIFALYEAIFISVIVRPFNLLIIA